jgi:tetratricopeptide (TPR) repeat protein
MKRASWLGALLAFTLGAAEAHAQIFVPYPSGGVTISARSRFGRASISLYGPLNGVGYGYGYGRISVYQIYSPPPIIIVNGSVDPLARRRRLPLALEPLDDEEDPPPARLPKRPVRPQPREEEDVPMPPRRPPEREPDPERELVPPPQPEPPAKPPERKRPEPPKVVPEVDPLAESARHIKLGRQAFADGEYGRAAFRFRQAANVAPREPLAYFLLAQAQLALGKYRDAVESIRSGIDLRPDWPTTGIKPTDLYGGNAAEFADHLERLEATLAQHPNDPILLFLHGYFLWFDGRKEEARPLFERAAPLVPDRTTIDRFLEAKPG